MRDRDLWSSIWEEQTEEEGVNNYLTSEQAGPFGAWLFDNKKKAVRKIADCTSPIPFFVLTYKDRVLGASIMANSDVLEKIGDVFGDNYLLAPSSIHELLVVRDDKGAAENLTKACREGNNKDVLPSDVLSDKVLRYDFKHKTLKNAIGDRVRAREEEMESEKREKPKRKGR